MAATPESPNDIDPRAEYTVAQIAFCTGYHYRTIYKHIRKKSLIGKKPKGGTCIFVTGSDFQRWWRGT